MKNAFVKFTQTYPIDGYPTIVHPEVLNLGAIVRVIYNAKGTPLGETARHEVACLDVWLSYSPHPCHYSGEVAERLWALLQNEAIDLAKF